MFSEEISQGAAGEMMASPPPFESDESEFEKRLKHAGTEAVKLAIQGFSERRRMDLIDPDAYDYDTALQHMQKTLRDVLHSKVLKMTPMDENAFLPFQSLLNDTEKQAIDMGHMDIVDIANSDEFPVVYHDNDFGEHEITKTRINYTCINPIKPRAVNSKVSGVPFNRMKGIQASSVALWDLWCLASPPHHHPVGSTEEPTRLRASLATALLNLRNVAMVPTKPNIGEYMYFECNENSIGGGNSRLNFCGQGFRICKVMAELWNSATMKYHNFPPKGTEAYEQVQAKLFTSEDCARVIAAVSRACQKQPARTSDLSGIFYGCSSPLKPRSVGDIAELHQPPTTMRTDEIKQARIDLKKKISNQPSGNDMVEQTYFDDTAPSPNVNETAPNRIDLNGGDRAHEIIDLKPPEAVLNSWFTARQVTPVVHEHRDTERQFSNHGKGGQKGRNSWNDKRGSQRTSRNWRKGKEE